MPLAPTSCLASPGVSHCLRQCRGTAYPSLPGKLLQNLKMILTAKNPKLHCLNAYLCIQTHPVLLFVGEAKFIKKLIVYDKHIFL